MLNVSLQVQQDKPRDDEYSKRLAKRRLEYLKNIKERRAKRIEARENGKPRNDHHK